MTLERTVGGPVLMWAPARYVWAQWWREGVEDGRDKSCPIDVTGYSVSKLKL